MPEVTDPRILQQLNRRGPINTGTDPRVDIARQAEGRAQAEFEQKQQDRALEAQDRAKQEDAQASALDDAKYQIRNVIKAAKSAKKKSDDWFATGFGASVARGIGGTSAADVEALLNTISANTAFDRLQKMRDASKTGGALGQVSERELALLRDSIASISQTQSDEQFQTNMQQVIDSYQRVLDRLEGPSKTATSDDDLIRKYLD